MAYGKRNDGNNAGWRKRPPTGGNGGGWRRKGIWTRKHYENADSKNRKESSKQPGIGIADIAEQLGTVTKALSFLAERIQILERGSDQNPDRPISGQTKSAEPRTQIKSNNDEFASVVKDLYRMVQLDHHADNWNELPKSLAERLVRLAEGYQAADGGR